MLKMKEIASVGDGEGEGEGGVLPDGIVEDILSRLQSKTLMKLRIVCKKWKSSISTSYFKRLHDEQSLESPNLLLLSRYPPYGCVLTTMSLTGDVLDEWDLGLGSHKFFEILPSQWGPNNLVCLITESKRFVLCNPSVRKISRVPQQSCSKRVGAYGFCYLPSRNQYVIISVSGGHQWEMITFSNINNLEDLHTYCWKPIEDNPPGRVMNMPAGVFANGVLSWIGLTHSWSQSLLCFDLYKEKFFTVAFQDEIIRAFPWSLHELKGDLHLMTPGDLAANALSTLWKLDATKQTWIKQYTVYLPRPHSIPLMACEDGELMFHDGKSMKWFSLRDEVFRISREGDERNPRSMYKQSMKLHTDSLVLS